MCCLVYRCFGWWHGTQAVQQYIAFWRLTLFSFFVLSVFLRKKNEHKKKQKEAKRTPAEDGTFLQYSSPIGKKISSFVQLHREHSPHIYTQHRQQYDHMLLPLFT